MSHYSLTSSEVQRQLNLFQANFVGLTGEELRKPDFQLSFPEGLTKKAYVQIISKLLATIRYKVYSAIRQLVRPRQDKYITKAEMKDILGSLDTRDMRASVFTLYGVKGCTEDDLLKAYYTFMIDQPLVQKIRSIKQAHERFMI